MKKLSRGGCKANNFCVSPLNKASDIDSVYFEMYTQVDTLYYQTR